jgi:hypothetical protein
MRFIIIAAFLTIALPAASQAPDVRLTPSGYSSITIGMMEADAAGRMGYVPDTRPG